MFRLAALAVRSR